MINFVISVMRSVLSFDRMFLKLADKVDMDLKKKVREKSRECHNHKP